MSNTTVRRNSEMHRYELLVEGEPAGFAEYNELSTRFVFTHTLVFPEFQGKGYSAVLIQHALEDVRSLGKYVVPICPAVAAFLRKHPEFQDLLTEETRRARSL
jgi:predicted GNAT family acetyltransferase